MMWHVKCVDCGYEDDIDDTTTTVPSSCPSCTSANILLTPYREV